VEPLEVLPVEKNEGTEHFKANRPSDVLFVMHIRKEHFWIVALGLLALVLWMRLSVVSSKLALLETTLALGSK
jgi:Na+/H+ antiporter NhaC